METNNKFNIRSLFNTKKKKVITSCIVAVVIIATIGGVYAFNNNDTNKLLLKKAYTKTITLEYGNSINNDTKTYLDTTDLDKEDKKDVLSLTKIVVKTKDNKKAVNESNKDYLACGDYKVILTYKEESANVKVKIEDTTKPTIDGVNSIDIVQGTDLNTYDFCSLFTIKDLSKVDTKIDHSKIDVNTVGSYKLNITATDSSKNELSKEVNVNITAKPSEDEEVVTETVTNADGSKSVKTTTKKKAASSSSNSSSSGNTTSKPSTNTNISTPGTPSKPSTPSTPSKPTTYYFMCRACKKTFSSTNRTTAYNQLVAHWNIEVTNNGYDGAVNSPAYFEWSE